MRRRERGIILGDVLAALDAAQKKQETRSTRIALTANLPYDRFQEQVAHLRGLGFVDGDSPPALTEAGREQLRRFQNWREALRLFGLRYKEATHEP